MERNDIDGAVEAFRAGCLDGTWTSDLARIYLRLQDDPRPLMAEFRRLCETDPQIAAHVERISKVA